MLTWILLWRWWNTWELRWIMSLGMRQGKSCPTYRRCWPEATCTENSRYSLHVHTTWSVLTFNCRKLINNKYLIYLIHVLNITWCCGSQIIPFYGGKLYFLHMQLCVFGWVCNLTNVSSRSDSCINILICSLAEGMLCFNWGSLTLYVYK